MGADYQALCIRAKDQLAARVDEHRLLHSVSVAQTARSLAETYGVDPHQAELVGMLHDWDRGLSDEQLIDRARELGLTLEPGIEQAAVLLHGPTGAIAVQQAFPELDPEIVQAIARHTTVAPDMSALDMIIYIADAIEPMRVRDNLIPIRALVGTASLETLFVAVFKMNWDYERSLDSFILASEQEAVNTYLAPKRANGDLENE